jgi:hypothetical protein
MTQDLQFVHASAAAIKVELSAKSATLDELGIREHEAQARLQTLGDEKKV